MRLVAMAILCAVAAPAHAAPMPVEVGSPAPNFTRQDFDGRPVALDSYRGKVVLLDFWASWCGPCLEEMPKLIALQKRNEGQLQIVGISMDDRIDAARSVTRRFTFNYPLVMGDAALGNSYGGILGLPEIFLIGRGGKVLKVWRGEISADALDLAVETALSRP